MLLTIYASGSSGKSIWVWSSIKLCIFLSDSEVSVWYELQGTVDGVCPGTNFKIMNKIKRVYVLLYLNETNLFSTGLNPYHLSLSNRISLTIPFIVQSANFDTWHCGKFTLTSYNFIKAKQNRVRTYLERKTYFIEQPNIG